MVRDGVRGYWLPETRVVQLLKVEDLYYNLFNKYALSQLKITKLEEKINVLNGIEQFYIDKTKYFDRRGLALKITTSSMVVFFSLFVVETLLLAFIYARVYPF